MTKLSFTETRVLQAIELSEQVARRDYENAGWEARGGDPTPQHWLLGFDSIKLSARIVANRRKSSERDLYSALQKLVARGLVEKSTVRGMGGGLTLYIRKEA